MSEIKEANIEFKKQLSVKWIKAASGHTYLCPVDALNRFDRQLDELERLSELLATEDTYVVEPFDGQLPDTFKLSVVIPVFNEIKTIGRILCRVAALPLNLELVIVDDFSFKLRAERSGGGSGRVYTITYMVTDDCGNSATASATVTVPKSQAKKK